MTKAQIVTVLSILTGLIIYPLADIPLLLFQGALDLVTLHAAGKLGPVYSSNKPNTDARQGLNRQIPQRQ
jgi:hypothetical protein